MKAHTDATAHFLAGCGCVTLVLFLLALIVGSCMETGNNKAENAQQSAPQPQFLFSQPLQQQPLYQQQQPILRQRQYYYYSTPQRSVECPYSPNGYHALGKIDRRGRWHCAYCGRFMRKRW